MSRDINNFESGTKTTAVLCVVSLFAITRIRNWVKCKSYGLPISASHLSERNTLTPFVKRQKYTYLHIERLKLEVEIIFQLLTRGYCNCSGDMKRAYGFHGTPSKFHCFSFVPLILPYNVYSPVNWTGASLWVRRTLPRGCKSLFLPNAYTSLKPQQHLKEVQLFFQEWFTSDCVSELLSKKHSLAQNSGYKLNY